MTELTDASGGVAEQILVAAVETAATHGISRLNVGDVARRAGLSRQTVYRHFPSKDALVAAAVAREADLLMARVLGAAEGVDDHEAGLRTVVREALEATREHPLLDRLLRTEPETLLPLLVGNGAISRRVRDSADLVAGAVLPDLSPERRVRVADLVSRIIMSFAVTPPDDSAEELADFLAEVLTHGLLAPSTTP